MGARRSDKRRTAIALPRGNRHPRSASTVLLSFALLAALSTPLGARGLSIRGAGALGASKTPSGVASSAATKSSAASLRSKRAAVALEQDTDSATRAFSAVTAPPDVGAEAVASDRIEAGVAAALLAFASDSSRTRGHPVSDC